MPSIKPHVVGALAVFFVAACGSSPKTQFYTLDPVPGPHASAAISGAPVQVAAVHIPPALDRQEMIRERAPHQLEVSDQNRWGASLDDMTRRVLTQDLAVRLPSGMLVLPQEPAPRAADTIVVDILEFDQQANGLVTFDGSWSLTRRGADRALLNRHVTLTEPAAAGNYGDQAAAMSRILGKLANEMVATLAVADRVPVRGEAAAALP
jgi:hypothetical protein